MNNPDRTLTESVEAQLLWQAMRARHSVRTYLDKPIDGVLRTKLAQQIDSCNRKGGLHIQLVTDEPKAFGSTMAHYGKFSGVTNYIALIGPKDAAETCGYYGEHLALYAQQQGLNTCWVALTYSRIKGAYQLGANEKLHLVIAIGYGATQGTAHRSKAMGELCRVNGDMPDWFRRGMEAAMLAPTALNQQKFTFSLDGRRVSAKSGFGPHAKTDLGIAKYHFEAGAGKENFEWA
ncbi:MAG: nitroreductase family protein [Clostridia bacterium]|nr:nitroreductase family protein [Clostridia bacterium]